MKERIILLGLSVVLASGILIQTVQDIVNHTILDEQWHYKIQSDIYYRERLVQQVNQNIDHIVTKYGLSKQNHQRSVPNLNIRGYLNYQVEQLLKLDPDEPARQQANFNDEIERLIERDVEQYIVDLNVEIDSELENDLKTEMKNILLHPLSIVKDMGLMRNSQSILFDVLIPLTSPTIKFLMTVSLIGSIGGIFLISKFKLYRITTYISSGCLMSGTVLHLINYFSNPMTLSYVSESVSIQDQLFATAQLWILNLMLVAGKLLMIIGIFLFVVTQGIKEYRRIVRVESHETLR